MPSLSTAPQAETPSLLTPEELATLAATITAQIDLLTAQKKAALEQLLTLHDLGRVDSKLALPDGWTLQWSAGRQTYDYPPDVIELEAQLQAAKEAAVAARRATPKPASPFWTVRKPRPAADTSKAYWAGRNHAAGASA